MQQEGKLEIEKLSEIKEIAQQDEIVFDNKGEMHVNNRDYRRDPKRLWRSTMEDKPLRTFTKKRHKTNRKIKKAERQNRKKGRK